MIPAARIRGNWSQSASRCGGFKMRATFAALAVWLLLSTYQVTAGECVIAGPPAKLDSDAVDWALVIASGQSCVRGLRWGGMMLDNVRISSPSKSGEAAVQGYSFVYRARPDFKGEDTFSVVIAGSNRGIRGTSTIRVLVSVR
jgi:hypothetical protein